MNFMKMRRRNSSRMLKQPLVNSLRAKDWSQLYEQEGQYSRRFGIFGKDFRGTLLSYEKGVFRNVVLGIEVRVVVKVKDYMVSRNFAIVAEIFI